MLNLSDLKHFLVKAKTNTYASGDLNLLQKQPDHSTTITYQEGDFKYHDNFFGGEPYGGREVVFFKGKPVYLMVYYGSFNKNIKDLDKLYLILQKALTQIPPNYPFRDPKLFESKNLQYLNQWQGSINNFSGHEKILKNHKPIYSAKYIGGLVDQKRD